MEALLKKPETMKYFFQGMATIGELSPTSVSLDEYLPQYNAWQWVANSFAQAGYSIWLAMEEFPKITQSENN